jgi:(p)ppGpp synthase/HD superfamily hydrolase
MYSPAIDRALAAALSAHDGQWRKGGERVPYALHPLHVALMLARLGYEEDMVVAGLLHDAVEDAPQTWTVARVEREFGAHVASIVSQLSEDKSKSWEERKRSGIDRVPHLSPEAASVKAADQLHNLHSLARELREAPEVEAVWARFRGGRERTLAMSSELVSALTRRVDPKLARALESALRALLEVDRQRAGRVVQPS